MQGQNIVCCRKLGHSGISTDRYHWHVPERWMEWWRIERWLEFPTNIQNPRWKLSFRKCHTFVPNLRAIQQNCSHHSIHQNFSHRSIRHHSYHPSRKGQWDLFVQIPEFPSLHLVSSFHDLRDQLSMFRPCASFCTPELQRHIPFALWSRMSKRWKILSDCWWWKDSCWWSLAIPRMRWKRIAQISEWKTRWCTQGIVQCCRDGVQRTTIFLPRTWRFTFIFTAKLVRECEFILTNW